MNIKQSLLTLLALIIIAGIIAVVIILVSDYYGTPVDTEECRQAALHPERGIPCFDCCTPAPFFPILMIVGGLVSTFATLAIWAKLISRYSDKTRQPKQGGRR